MNEQPVDERATAVDFGAALQRVAEAFNALMSLGLNERAIVLLLHDAIGQRHGTNVVTKVAIRQVIQAARELPDRFSPKPAPPVGP
jgi:hypothetical protein